MDLSPIAKIRKITPNNIFSLFEITCGSRINDYNNKMLIVSENQVMLYQNYYNKDVVKYYNIELCDESDIEKEVKRQEKLF